LASKDVILRGVSRYTAQDPSSVSSVPKELYKYISSSLFKERGVRYKVSIYIQVIYIYIYTGKVCLSRIRKINTIRLIRFLYLRPQKTQKVPEYA